MTSRRLPLRFLGAALLLATGLLAGCGTSDTGATTTPSSAEASASASRSASDPSTTPAASASSSARPASGLQKDAEGVLAALDGKIDPAGASEKDLRDRLVAAGWPDAAIETGQNLTPTGLDVDNVDAAVATKNGCVLADVRGNGGVTVTTARKLSTGRCLIGTVHR